MQQRGRSSSQHAKFFNINGCRFMASEVDATQAIMRLAARTLDEKDFVKWLRENTE
jgi:prophage maintenance system killer protein